MLDTIDYLIIFIAILLVWISTDSAFQYFSWDTGLRRNQNFIIAFVLYFSCSSTSLGIRFGNFYFSLIWILLCLIFYVNSNFELSLLPILGVGLYHLIRFIYFENFKREFIPGFMSNSGYDFRFSKSENRQADKNDMLYSFFLFICSFVILIIYALISK